MPDTETATVETDAMGFDYPVANVVGNGFEIRVEGEVVHTVDIDPSLVERIHIEGPTGAVTTIGSAFNANHLNLKFEYRSYNNLEVLDEERRAAWRERAEEEKIHSARPSGKLVGEEQAEEDKKAGEPEEEEKPKRSRSTKET